MALRHQPCAAGFTRLTRAKAPRAISFEALSPALEHARHARHMRLTFLLPQRLAACHSSSIEHKEFPAPLGASSHKFEAHPQNMTKCRQASLPRRKDEQIQDVSLAQSRRHPSNEQAHQKKTLLVVCSCDIREILQVLQSLTSPARGRYITVFHPGFWLKRFGKQPRALARQG